MKHVTDLLNIIIGVDDSERINNNKKPPKKKFKKNDEEEFTISPANAMKEFKEFAKSANGNEFSQIINILIKEYLAIPKLIVRSNTLQVIDELFTKSSSFRKEFCENVNVNHFMNFTVGTKTNPLKSIGKDSGSDALELCRETKRLLENWKNNHAGKFPILLILYNTAEFICNVLEKSSNNNHSNSNNRLYLRNAFANHVYGTTSSSTSNSTTTSNNNNNNNNRNDNIFHVINLNRSNEIKNGFEMFDGKTNSSSSLLETRGSQIKDKLNEIETVIKEVNNAIQLLLPIFDTINQNSTIELNNMKKLNKQENQENNEEEEIIWQEEEEEEEEENNNNHHDHRVYSAYTKHLPADFEISIEIQQEKIEFSNQLEDVKAILADKYKTIKRALLPEITDWIYVMEQVKEEGEVKKRIVEISNRLNESIQKCKLVGIL